MSFFITNFIAAFLLPPLNVLLLLIAGIVWFDHRKLARPLLITSCGLLWLFSTPFFAATASQWLETSTKPLVKPLHAAEAIVILGGGTYYNAPEYDNQDTVNDNELARLRYGAKLYREKPLPILVSGGKPAEHSRSEAQQMRAVLVEEFHVPVRWLEQNSTNTYENALFSQKILQQADIKTILLVTHAVDMRRAAKEFRRLGFTVLEAPTIFTTRNSIDLFAFIPDARAMSKTSRFFHELIGIVWYSVKS